MPSEIPFQRHHSSFNFKSPRVLCPSSFKARMTQYKRDAAAGRGGGIKGRQSLWSQHKPFSGIGAHAGNCWGREKKLLVVQWYWSFRQHYQHIHPHPVRVTKKTGIHKHQSHVVHLDRIVENDIKRFSTSSPCLPHPPFPTVYTCTLLLLLTLLLSNCSFPWFYLKSLHCLTILCSNYSHKRL